MSKFEKWLKKIWENQYSGFYVLPTILIYEEGLYLHWLKKQITVFAWCEI